MDRTDLHFAALDGDTARVEQLLATGAEVNAQDSNGDTPLHLAAQEYRVDAATSLLRAGASVELRDLHGNTVLWRATFNSHGRGDLILLLLEHHADPDSTNAAGATPRSLATQIANYDVRRFFEAR